MRLLLLLKGITDPEKKRKCIGAGFIRVFDEYADMLMANNKVKPRYLVQVCMRSLSMR